MTDISRLIWDMKYRLKAQDGTPVDADIADLRAAAADSRVFMSMPRIVQCWARAG